MAVASAQPAVIGDSPNRLVPPEKTPAAAELEPELTATELPEAGKTWLGQFQVSEALGEVAGARAWRAQRLDTAEDVILRAIAAAGSDRRKAAWRAL